MNGSNLGPQKPTEDLKGVGSPRGMINGILGQKYYDTTHYIWYVCVSDPTGTDWQVI